MTALIGCLIVCAVAAGFVLYYRWKYMDVWKQFQIKTAATVDYRKAIIEYETTIFELENKLKGLENERSNIAPVDPGITANGAAALFDKLNG